MKLEAPFKYNGSVAPIIFLPLTLVRDSEELLEHVHVNNLFEHT